MPTLADIYSAADSFKRRLADAASNPSGSLQQMLGYANDRARNLRELERQADAEIKQGGFANQGPAWKELNQMAMDAVMAGMVNQPVKGSKLVHIPIDMIEHGEAVMPGGTLTFPNARKKIEEYAKKETSIPPIDIVSPEGGVGKWMVVDGSHRLEAAKLKGQTTIPAYVSPHDKEGLQMIKRQKIQSQPAKLPNVATTSDGYKFYEQPDKTWTNGDMTFDSLDELLSTDPQLTVNGKIYSPKSWMQEEAKGSDVHPLDYERTFDPNYDPSKGTFAHLYKQGFR